MKNLALLLIPVLMLLWAEPGHGDFLMVHGGKMSLEANNAPLQDLLKQLVVKGITVRIDPRINPRIFGRFTNKDVQKGFDDILKGYSHALIWSGGQDQNPRISEIIIFRPGQMDLARAVISESPNLAVVQDPDTGAFYVKNRVLAVFKPPAPLDRIRRILERFNGEMESVNPDMGIYAITLPESADARELVRHLKSSGINGVFEPDFAYRGQEISRVKRFSGDGDLVLQGPSPGAEDGFAVAVLDSGLRPEYENAPFIKGTFDALDPENQTIDPVGHGTQMALVASGQVAPMGDNTGPFSAPVLSIRAFDDNGFTSNTVLMRSIDHALENGAKVLSLSWGSENPSAFLESAVKYAASKGLIVVAAAGNSPTGKPVYPAAYDPVIAVSALSPDGKKWSRSNYGDFVDLAAPGFASLPVGSKADPGTYAGTSISTAFLAGKIAEYLRKNPGAKTIDLKGLASGK